MLSINRYKLKLGLKLLIGELEELQIYFRKTPLHQQNFWWSRFFLIRLGCREIWKNVENETTKLFSVGNTFSTCFYSNGANIYSSLNLFVSTARWHELRLWLYQDSIWKNGNNNEISDGFSELLVVYWLKEKPNNRKRTLVIG